MPTRRAFARPGLLLAVLSGVGAATFLLTAEPVHAPTPAAVERVPVAPPDARPQFGLPLCDGRTVSLVELNAESVL
jgi:hypothetical protein